MSDETVKELRPESVLMGRDHDALAVLLAMHAPPDPRILDCTYNSGKMWRGLEYKPTRMDIDPAFEVDVVGDFRAMPFAAGSFDVVVFDPPHLPNAGGTEKSCSSGADNYRADYGLTDAGDVDRDADHVGGYFPKFFAEAKRVLSPDGIVLAKIADLIHNHRYQFQHVDLIVAARAAGMTPCDLMVKRDPAGGNLKSSRWQKAFHLRNCHCYWIVVRNSKRCERRRAA